MLKADKIFEFNMKKPTDCFNYNCTAMNKWISSKGVNVMAADMKNFENDPLNETLTDLNWQLDLIGQFEKEMVNKTREANSTLNVLEKNLTDWIAWIEN